MKKIFITLASIAFIFSIFYAPLHIGASTKIVHAYSVGQTCNNAELQCDAGLDCYIPQGLTQGSCQETMSGVVKVGSGGGSGVGNGSGGSGVGNGNGGSGVGNGNGSVGTGNGNGSNGVGNGSNSNCGPTQLCNPLLPQYGSLCDVLNGIIVLVTQIGAVIAVLLIIWTGFRFISAQGNTTKLTDAKRAFYAVLLGTAILLGASGIATIVVKTVLTVTNQNNPGICKI